MYQCFFFFFLFFKKRKYFSMCCSWSLKKSISQPPPPWKLLKVHLDKTLEIASSLLSLKTDGWDAMLWLDKLKYKIIDLWTAAELLRIISKYIFGTEEYSALVAFAAHYFFVDNLASCQNFFDSSVLPSFLLHGRNFGASFSPQNWHELITVFWNWEDLSNAWNLGISWKFSLYTKCME